MEMSIPKPWIPKEGEVPTNEGCRGNWIHGCDLKCFEVQTNYLLGRRMRKDVTKAKRWKIEQLKFIDSDGHHKL